MPLWNWLYTEIDKIIKSAKPIEDVNAKVHINNLIADESTIEDIPQIPQKVDILEQPTTVVTTQQETGSAELAQSVQTVAPKHFNVSVDDTVVATDKS